MRSGILSCPIVSVSRSSDASGYDLTYLFHNEQRTLHIQPGHAPWSRIRQVSPVATYPKISAVPHTNNALSIEDITELYVHFSPNGEIVEHVSVPVMDIQTQESGDKAVRFTPPGQPISSYILPKAGQTPGSTIIVYDHTLPEEVDLEILPAQPLQWGVADYNVLAVRLHR